jgi:hypothetical protein
VQGGFTLDDFTVDEDTATVTCPAGLTARITRTRKVTFAARCRGCPFRTRCTSSSRGRKLTLCTSRNDCNARTDYAPANRSSRPSIASAVRWPNAPSPGLVAGSNRPLSFRGTRLNDLWLHDRVTELNLRRLLALGLTRTCGAWTTA